MSKGIEKEIKNMGLILKESMSHLEQDYDYINIKDRYHVIELLKLRGKDSCFINLSQLYKIRNARDFSNLVWKCVDSGLFSSRNVKNIVDKVNIIEHRVSTLYDIDEKYAELLNNTLKAAMKSTVYNCIAIEKSNIHRTFAVMFKIAYTLLNSDIDLHSVNSFYDRTAVITCAAMKRPNHMNLNKMTPVEKYEDILYYRISDTIIEDKDYLRNYIKDYCDKFNCNVVKMAYILCSDFIWDVILRYKK